MTSQGAFLGPSPRKALSVQGKSVRRVGLSSGSLCGALKSSRETSYTVSWETPLAAGLGNSRTRPWAYSPSASPGRHVRNSGRASNRVRRRQIVDVTDAALGHCEFQLGVPRGAIYNQQWAAAMARISKRSSKTVGSPVSGYRPTRPWAVPRGKCPELSRALSLTKNLAKDPVQEFASIRG